MRYRLTIARSLTLRADVDVEASSELEARVKALAFIPEIPEEGWEVEQNGTPWIESARPDDA